MVAMIVTTNQHLMLVSLPQKSHNMKELSDKQELKVRKESKHLGIKYVCDLCEYKSTKKQLLRARARIQSIMESNIVVMNVITEQTAKVFSKCTLNQNITEKHNCNCDYKATH